jgi:hypothetical protein
MKGLDSDFISFVKSRLLETPLVDGDSVFVVILGSAIPFTVLRAKPRGIVKIVSSTSLQVLSEPSAEKKGIPLDVRELATASQQSSTARPRSAS